LVYGEDPSEGFVRGRRFLHPKLGFTFLAPEGFLSTTPRRRFSVKEGGGQALRLDVVRVPAEQTLAGTSPQAGSRISTPRPSRGQHQWTAGCNRNRQGDQWVFRLYAVRFGTDVASFCLEARPRKSIAPFADRSAPSAV
jgi:predicted Zn-dependent protease